MTDGPVIPPRVRMIVRLLGRCVPRRHREVFEGDLIELWNGWNQDGAYGPDLRLLWAGIKTVPISVFYSITSRAERGHLERQSVEGSLNDLGRGLTMWSRLAGLWTDLASDLRVAFRRMARAPGFTGIAVLSIALGVGGNTALFAILQDALLGQPAYDDPERMVDVRLVEPGDEFGAFSWTSFHELEEATRDAFSGITGVMFNMVSLNDGSGGANQNLMNELVVGPYFQVLGINAQIGRVFDPSEGTELLADPIVVLSDSYWRRAFGADEDVIGSEVVLNGYAYQVVGVAEPSFSGLLPGIAADLWALASMSDQISLNGTGSLTRRGQEAFLVKARLAPGVEMAQAEARLRAFAEDLFPRFPDNYSGAEIVATPTIDARIHPAIDRVVVPMAALVMAVVAMVLLIACVNLAGFLLARAEGRRREIAVRLALGSRRGRLIRGLLTETALLAALGGALGLVLSVVLVDVLLGIPLPLPLPLSIDAGLDGSVFAFALTISVLAGLILGLAPALQTTRPDLSSTLKDESTGGRGRRIKLRDVLVVGQVAGSVTLLVLAGLFIRSLGQFQSIDPGFGNDPGAIAWLELPNSRSSVERQTFFEELVRRLEALPTVESVGLVTMLPLEGTGTSTRGVTVPGVDPPAGRSTHEVDWAAASEGYFNAMGMKLVSGRTFSSLDDQGTEPVAIVNEAFAQRFWPGEDALGRAVVMSGQEHRVAGVTANIKYRSLSEGDRPLFYTPSAQLAQPYGRVVAKTSNPTAVQEEMLRIASAVDPGVIVINSKTMEQHLGFMLLPARISAFMLGLMGGLALMLAAIGLYGIVAYSVAARDREMGIRMSIGAAPGGLVSLVMKSGMKRVLLGLALGLVLAAGLTRVVSSALYGVGTLDGITYLGVVVLLLLVATLAAYIPARRASRVDPVVALTGS